MHLDSQRTSIDQKNRLSSQRMLANEANSPTVDTRLFSQIYQVSLR